MKTTFLIRCLVLAGIFLTSAPLNGETDDNGPFDDSDINDAPDVYVKLEAVPQAVVEALRADAEGIVFTEVELDMDSDVPQYVLEWERDGRLFETTVGEEGDLVKRDEQLAPTKVPEPIQRVTKAFFPSGAFLQAEHTMQVTYCVEETDIETTRFLEISPAGRVLHFQGLPVPDGEIHDDEEDLYRYDSDYLIYRPILANELPKHVRDRLLEEAVPLEGHEITQRETYIGGFTYILRWTSDGRDFERHVSDTGELLVQSKSLTREELPTNVQKVVARYFALESDDNNKIVMKQTATYDIDADFATIPSRLILEPGGRILRASGLPDRRSAAPTINIERNAVVVTQPALLGLPRPRLEVSTDMATDSWTEVPLTPNRDDRWEARLPRDSGAFIRVRYTDD